jgi:signal transduction histidine kinase
VLAALLGAACLPSAVVAQNRIARSLSMEDGLVNPQVSALFEDRDGFLWIGTLEGVSRFDGLTFTNYSAGDGVPIGRIYAFYQAPDGRLFVAGEGGGAVWNGRRFLPLPRESGLAGSYLQGVAGLPDGTLFFGGRKGLAARRPDGRWETVLSDEVTALFVTRDGTLYVGTKARGVLMVREGKILPLAGSGVDEAFAFGEGSDGTLYVGTSRGLAVLRGGFLQVAPFTRRHQIRSIAVADDGVLYLGTKVSGVLRLRVAGLEPLGSIASDSGLSINEVHAVHAVRGGPVFFGTDDGLDVFGGDAFETWTRAQGLPDARVWSIAEDARGDLYAAGAMGGVAVLKSGKWRIVGRQQEGPVGKTTSVHLGKSGRLYVGDSRGRVWVVREGRFFLFAELPERCWVTAILEGPGGEVYAASLEGFAVLRRNQPLRFFRPRDGLPDREVYSLALAADGTLYLATAGGLATFRNGAFGRVWTRKDGLASSLVSSVRAGQDGSIYAGTEQGFSILRSGRIETYDTADGLTSNVINCVLEDGGERFYLSTNRGVNVLDLHAPVRATALPAYGLGRRTGNLGACFRDHRGRLWFGIHSALTVFDPAQERPRRPPRILLTASPSDRNDLTFSLGALDLAAHSMRFRYRLAGVDRTWMETDQRSVRYPSLQPGSYRFAVRAVNDAGLWSATAELPVTIPAPPLWQRPALVLGLAALGVALAAGLYALARVRQLLEVERLRTAIAADLHDQIGAGLTDIAILSEVAVRKAGDLPELTRVAATARDLVDGLGDIVWLVNPRRDSLYELFLRLKDSYADLFAHAGAQLEVGDLSPFETVRLPMAWRQNLHLLFQEALRNALRHSGCRRAELTVTLDRRRGRRLDIVLRDDGHGFDVESRSGQGEGLETMRRRAERLGGRLTIESSAAGTAVRFAGAVS